MRPALRRSASAVVLALGITATSPASAEVTAPLATTLHGEAKTAYAAATTLFGVHDYVGAAAKYRVALNASHDPRLLYNIAACEKELRHYARASALVDQFLREASSKVAPGVIAQVKATQAALQGLFSRVRFNVEPEGAVLFIDGEDMGRALFAELVPVDLGKHVARVELPGYATAASEIEITASETAALEIKLTPVPSAASDPNGMLLVTPSEPKDTVYIDGKAVGVGRWEGALAAGTHHLRVTGEGKKPFLADVELGHGEHRSMDATLEKDTHKMPLWPWLTAGAVVIAGGVVGTYFLVKGAGSDTVTPLPGGRNPVGGVTLNGFGR